MSALLTAGRPRAARTATGGFTLAAAVLGFFVITFDAVIVKGASAAVMMPSSMALIRQAYQDPGRRARAIAMWAMAARSRRDRLRVHRWLLRAPVRDEPLPAAS